MGPQPLAPEAQLPGVAPWTTAGTQAAAGQALVRLQRAQLCRHCPPSLTLGR